MELWALFVSAFISSTLLPGGSEIALALLAAKSEYSSIILIGIATLGNTLGGMTSWGIGYLLPDLDKKYQRSPELIKRYGSPILLFSWLPIIGDPFCLVAGWLRIPFWRSLLFISVGKFLRYCVVVYFVS